MADRQVVDGAASAAPLSQLDTLLTAEEAAHFLRVQVHTLQRLRWQGLGPAYIRHGNYVRYVRQDLESWINSLRAPGQVKASARHQPHATPTVRA